MIRLMIALALLAGCYEDIEYIPSSQHHEEWLALEVFTEWYQQELDVDIQWTRDLTVDGDDVLGLMVTDRSFPLWPEYQCDTIYVVDRDAWVEYTSLIHELTHCLLWVRHFDLDPVPPGYDPDPELADHRGPWWDEIPKINRKIQEKRNEDVVDRVRSDGLLPPDFNGDCVLGGHFD